MITLKEKSILEGKSKHRYLFNLKNILLENNESYYWLGFFMADGWFANGINFILSEKDESHLRKLVEYLNIKRNIKKFSKNGYPQVSIHLSDTRVERILRDRFKLHIGTKTTNPPCLKCIKNKDNLFSFLIGYIDGDGHIRKVTKRSTQIALECHVSWKPIYEMFETFIYKYFKVEKRSNFKKYTRINKRGMVCLCFSRQMINLMMKNRAIELKLPLMERKWKDIPSDVFRCQKVF